MFIFYKNVLKALTLESLYPLAAVAGGYAAASLLPKPVTKHALLDPQFKGFNDALGQIGNGLKNALTGCAGDCTHMGCDQVTDGTCQKKCKFPANIIARCGGGGGGSSGGSSSSSSDPFAVLGQTCIPNVPIPCALLLGGVALVVVVVIAKS